MGELRAGIVGGCPAAGSQAGAWAEESRHGLQWDISRLVAAVSASKPVPGQTLGLMIILGTLLKKIFQLFFFLSSFGPVAYFFILPVASESCYSHHFAFKAASLKLAGVHEGFLNKRATIR